MKLTNKTEYALLALIYLARSESDNYITVEMISKKQNISVKFLEQILLILKRAKYLYSFKGQNGGYKLAKPANKINLAEVIRLFDGALAPTESVSKYYYEKTPIEKEKSLVKVFRDIRDYISDKLENTTLDQLV